MKKDQADNVPKIRQEMKLIIKTLEKACNAFLSESPESTTSNIDEGSRDSNSLLVHE